jgi:hypothetical protein
MISSVRVRAGAGLLFACVLTLGGCSSDAPAPPPAPPPVAEGAPPPPPVLLPREVVDAASVFEAYVQRASTIEPNFSGGDSVAASLRVGETYEIDQLQRGEAAYGAIVALQDPTFVASLRAYAYDAASRTQIVDAVLIDPAYITHFKGSDSAAGLVIAALSQEGQKLLSTGDRIRQAAYDVQHQSWSKAEVPDRQGRLALAKTLSSQQQQAAPQDALRLTDAVNGVQPLGLAAPPAAAPYTPLVTRALAVAAMAAMGEGGEEYAGQIRILLADDVENTCLHMAKLNLYQCLAVSKPHYEDVFCLGQHAVADTGQCVIAGAQLAAPLPVLIAAAPAAEVKPAKKTTGRRKAKGADAG